jgi:hypothetical protein
MYDESTPKMLDKTADILFGQSLPDQATAAVVVYSDRSQSTDNDFDRDLYELRKLADRVLGAGDGELPEDVLRPPWDALFGAG